MESGLPASRTRARSACCSSCRPTAASRPSGHTGACPQPPATRCVKDHIHQSAVNSPRMLSGTPCQRPLWSQGPAQTHLAVTPSSLPRPLTSSSCKLSKLLVFHSQHTLSTCCLRDKGPWSHTGGQRLHPRCPPAQLGHWDTCPCWSGRASPVPGCHTPPEHTWEWRHPRPPAGCARC